MYNFNDINDIKHIVAANICALRQDKEMTQGELAAALNYSDKAVSKWERAESLPDISVLTKIADIFDVTLDFLLQSSHSKAQEAVTSKGRKRRNRGFITGMCIILVWLLAMILFTVLDSVPAEFKNKWLVFGCSVPVSLVVWLIFNTIWFNRRLNFLIISFIMWSTLTLLYLALLPFNLWLLFVLGVPGQTIVVLWSRIKLKGVE